MYEYITRSEEETIAFAEEFATKLDKNSIIILSGDLGAGKTKFTQGILKYFGLENEISSPTFTIVNEYNAKDLNIYHFDLYRLADIDEFYAMGGEEYLQNGICIFEWGEILELELQIPYTKITFSRIEEDVNYRKICIEERNK